jgi:hypothetical protein
MRITAKFHDLGVDMELPDDELIGRAVAELYDGQATAEQMNAVLDVVDNLGRPYRGEPLRPTDRLWPAP